MELRVMINQVDKLEPQQQKKIQINITRNERGDIIADATEIQRSYVDHQNGIAGKGKGIAILWGKCLLCKMTNFRAPLYKMVPEVSNTVLCPLIKCI